jgi:hypothetical protein
MASLRPTFAQALPTDPLPLPFPEEDDMNRIATLLAHEFRKALPAIIFFLVLFHLIALTKAVVLGEEGADLLRAVAATVGALLVAKAILVVEALPIAGLYGRRRVGRILWKTFLFALVTLLFRVLEEMIPVLLRHEGMGAALRAMVHEIHWPLFLVLTLWIVGGLLLYCLAAEFYRALGAERVKGLLFDPAEETR